ncbi:LCP family protein [Streptomyces sp. NPDC005533]|uniref:LCP family protein n=1 Tax=Streptomyces sp. NPDC005533 TaxID=3364723 RepID=UPI003676334B
MDRPKCSRNDGDDLPAARHVLFNSIYDVAGPACVVNTVERMSGIRVDHFIAVDFLGFKGLVDALGGVTFTTGEAIHDIRRGCSLEPGTHKLNGENALKLVHTRYGYRDGSDLGRIGLQQQFILSLLTEIKKQIAADDPARLYKLIRVGTKALTTDSHLASLTALADFAEALKDISAKTAETVTLPVVLDSIDPNRVILSQPHASQLWEALRHDMKIPTSAIKEL